MTNLCTLPLVTIIMPIRNEADFIERSLASILRQDYPAERMEILIVDGMSDDQTRQLINRFIQTEQKNGPFHAPIRVLDNPARIVSPALNIGLKEAHGEIIIRVDGHCILPSNYVRLCVESHKRTGADNVGGQQYPVGETLIAQSIALATSTPFGIGNAKYRYSDKEEYVDTVYLGAYRRDVFERIGGFNEQLVRHQDYEFNTRLRQAGGKILYTPALKVDYHVCDSFFKLASQYLQYGFWKGRVTKQNSAVFKARHAVAPTFVLALFGGTLLSPFSIKLRQAVTMLCLLYSIACGLTALFIAIRQGIRYLLFLPFTFAILHFSWGIGFWSGLLYETLSHDSNSKEGRKEGRLNNFPNSSARA